MICLIAFALIVLACSFWKVSQGLADSGDDRGDTEMGPIEMRTEVAGDYEEPIPVIMAGDQEPRYLATPVCRQGGDCSRKSEGQEIAEENSLGDG